MMEIKGSYRGLIYIVIYQRNQGAVSWSASLEDDEGAVVFLTNHFICGQGKICCESMLRERIFASIDDYHRRNETPVLH